MTGSGEAGLREHVRGLLQAVEPPAAPVDVIIRRGRARRLRRAGVVAGGLGLAGIAAVATLLTPSRPPAPPHPPLPVTVPASGIAGPAGVFARGVADGHAWRLAVQDIADPGYRCLPAITVNGTDANLVQPSLRNYAAVAFGPAAPGLGFAFVQLPADVTGIVLDGQDTVAATTATACGLRYQLAGFAYRLAHPPQVTAAGAAGQLSAAVGRQPSARPPPQPGRTLRRVDQRGIARRRRGAGHPGLRPALVDNPPARRGRRLLRLDVVYRVLAAPE